MVLCPNFHICSYNHEQRFRSVTPQASPGRDKNGSKKDKKLGPLFLTS